jgi:hypothetical protein
MATVSPSTDFAPISRPATAAAAVGATIRDPRLDFFRGIAMYIILVAHIPRNYWTGWIPARFGFSDATEIFVFSSGMASAIAFGKAYEIRGWLMGSARVAYRVWQVYWAHIALFFFIAMTMAALDLYGQFDKSYVGSLNLKHFFDRPMQQIVGLFTLTYVPNYFDILPMYLVVLAMMPLFMALARISPWLMAAASISVWLVANPGMLGLGEGIGLPAEPWSDREWFFNPLGWQLLFFTGFAFMKGWLPAPPVSRTLIVLSAGFLIFSAPWGSWKVFLWVDAANGDLGDWIRQFWQPLKDFRNKSDFAILRFVHFLALAYLAYVAAGEGGRRLKATGDGLGARVWRFLLTVTSKVGQQSLAVFVFSMALARIIGFALDQTGRNPIKVALANLIGFAIITGVAYTAGWFKSHPWRASAK